MERKMKVKGRKMLTATTVHPNMPKFFSAESSCFISKEEIVDQILMRRAVLSFL